MNETKMKAIALVCCVLMGISSVSGAQEIGAEDNVAKNNLVEDITVEILEDKLTETNQEQAPEEIDVQVQTIETDLEPIVTQTEELLPENTFYKVNNGVPERLSSLKNGEIFYKYSGKNILSRAVYTFESATGQTLNIARPSTNATDGDMNTFTCGAGAWVQTMVMELEEECYIDNLSLAFHAGGYSKECYIETSVDGLTWSSAASIINDAPPLSEFISFDFEGRNARYIRIRDAEEKTGRQMRIAEIKVDTLASGVMVMGLYNRKTNIMHTLDIATIENEEAIISVNAPIELIGDMSEAEDVRIDMAQGQNVRGYLMSVNEYELPPSSSSLGVNVAENALDGNSATFACASNEWQWMYDLDLGTDGLTVGSVALTFGSAFEQLMPIDYEILVSSDRENWESVLTVRDNDSLARREHAFAERQARYIRVKDLKPQTNVSQMAISEIEVYEKAPFSCDYEIRVFGITNLDEKLPISKKVRILKFEE